MRIRQYTLCLIFGLLLAPEGLFAQQYAEQIERFQRLLLASKCESGATLIMKYWLDHPEKYHSGLDLRIVHTYSMSLPDSIRQPILDAKQFLSALYPDSIDLNRGRWWARRKWVRTGLVNAWQEGDSLLYSSSTAMGVSGLPLSRYSGEIKQMHQAFELLAVRISFNVFLTNWDYTFGLSDIELWVHYFDREDQGYKIITWDDFIVCCRDDFWESLILWRKEYEND